MKMLADDRGVILSFGAKLTVESLQDTLTSFKKGLAFRQPITLNAEELREMDVPGIQVLLVFLHAAKENEIEVTWESPSHKLTELAQFLGMNEALGFANQDKDNIG